MIESIYFDDPNGYSVEVTWQVRPFAAVDHEDAARTLAAAIDLEQRSSLSKIDQVWAAKGAALETAFAQAA